MKKILTVIGTRPEIIKMFPLISILDKKYNQKIIFSGQHFSKNMVDIFFNDLKIRQPDISIKIANKNNFYTEFYSKLFKIIKKEKPEAVIYHGDTLTTLVSATVCHFNFPDIKNIHIESGYRSKDNTPIEERIRKIVDKISLINFTIRKDEKNNLAKEGIKNKVYIVGNTIVDSLNIIIKKIKLNNKKKYVYATLHRSENVDNKERLGKIFDFLNSLSNKISILLCIHPRTKKMKIKYKLKLNKNIKIINGTNYTRNIENLVNSKFCITDSGGLQEESVILGKKCFIPAKGTPHEYYLGKKSNQLISLNKVTNVINYLGKEQKIKKFRHGKNVSRKICKILEKII